jgi:hypothetical protein
MDRETERAIEEIVAEIRELTLVMRGLGRTMSAIGDDEIEAFGKDVGSAGSQAHKAGEQIEELGQRAQKSARLVDQHGREFTKATEAATEATEADTEATEAATKAKKALTQEEFVYRRRQRSAFRDLAEEFSTTRGATARLQEGLFSATNSSALLQSGILLAESALRGLSSATISLTRDIYAGQRGAAVSARALNTLAKEVGTVAQGVGLAMAAFSTLSLFVPQMKLFGIAIKSVRGVLAGLGVGLAAVGITAKAAAEFNETAAEQNDRLFKGFNDLSQAGIGVVGGLDGLFESLQRAGLSVAEIEQFTSQLAANTQQLALMGTTTGAATRSFARVAGELRKGGLGQELEMLGIQAAEQRELVMGYMAQQARLGRLERRSTEELVQRSAKFARELDLMAQLTGASRKEQLEIRERQMADERFRSALAAAKARNDEAEITRLEKAQAIAAAVEAAGDKTGAQGILQIAAARGALTTPEAVAAEMTYGVNAVLNSQGTVTESLQQLVEQGKISQRALADTSAIVGTIPGYQTPVADLANVIDRLEPAIKRANELGIPLQQYLEEEQKRRTVGDKSLQQNVEAGRMQQNAAQIMDSIVRTYNASATIHQAASNAFQNAVNKFAETVGAAPVAGGQISVNGQAPASPQGGAEYTAPSFMSGGREGDASDTGAVPFPQGTPLQRAGRAIGGLVDQLELPKLFGSGQSQQYRAKSATVDPNSVLEFTGGLSGNPTNYDRLAPEFRDRINKMAQEYLQYTGKRMPFQSGHRTSEQNAAVGGADTSRHLEGKAADLGRDTVATLKRLGLLDRYGFKAGTSGSHVSDTGKKKGGISRGPDSGYLELLHGTEAVVPLPDGKSIPIAVSASTAGKGPGRSTADIDTMSQQIADVFSGLGPTMRQQIDHSMKPSLQHLGDVVRDLLDPTVAHQFQQAAEYFSTDMRRQQSLGPTVAHQFQQAAEYFSTDMRRQQSLGPTAGSPALDQALSNLELQIQELHRVQSNTSSVFTKMQESVMSSQMTGPRNRRSSADSIADFGPILEKARADIAAPDSGDISAPIMRLSTAIDNFELPPAVESPKTATNDGNRSLEQLLARQSDIMQNQTQRLDEIASTMRAQVNMSGRILQVSQN